MAGDAGLFWSFCSAWAIRAVTAIGSVFELAIGDAERAYSGREEDLVALSIALEGEAVAAGAPAVELDDEVVLRPVNVGLVAVEGEFVTGLGSCAWVDQVEESSFKQMVGAGEAGISDQRT